MAYSVLILTHNEAVNIRRCLDSLRAVDDVVIVDSFSTDDTERIAGDFPVRFVQRSFTNFADQRNWACDTIAFKHDWVLHLDADECMTPALHEEILGAASRDERSAFMLANKLMYMGRWIRRSSMYPHYQARLLKLGESRFEQRGHGQHLAHARRGVGTLREPYLHYNFSKGVTDWVARHNRYSTDEANRIRSSPTRLWESMKQVWTGDSAEARQQARKRCFDVMPCRPLIRFLYLYCWRCGFLDGRAGFHYCLLMAVYDYLIALKVRESTE